MDIFLKAVSGIIVALIIYLILSKQNKDLSLLLTIGTCCIIAIVAINYFEPIIAFVEKLQDIGKIDQTFLKIIFQSVGIGVLSEITTMICNDSGNTALGKSLQLLSGVVIICISLPLFQRIIELIEELILST